MSLPLSRFFRYFEQIEEIESFRRGDSNTPAAMMQKLIKHGK